MQSSALRKSIVSGDVAGARKHTFQTFTRRAVASDHASIEAEKSDLVFQEILLFLLQLVSWLSYASLILKARHVTVIHLWRVGQFTFDQLLHEHVMEQDCENWPYHARLTSWGKTRPSPATIF